jgi:hypothetical protein
MQKISLMNIVTVGNVCVLPVCWCCNDYIYQLQFIAVVYNLKQPLLVSSCGTVLDHNLAAEVTSSSAMCYHGFSNRN